jgi:hypothetical protein
VGVQRGGGAVRAPLLGGQEAAGPARELEKRFGNSKALSILAHKLGRTVYFMLRRGKAFDRERFLATVS